MSKCGTGKEHCCWFKGVQCEFLEPSNKEGFYWQCGLRAEAESWEEVHQNPLYVDNVKPKMAEIGYPDSNCGDWPLAGQKCNDCGQVG